jgi:oligopeptidase B
MSVKPPVAEQRLDEVSIHGDRRIDEYYWIRDDQRSDPDVLALLTAENQYTRDMLAHTEPLQEALFQEISLRLPSRDRSVPVKKGDYRYFREFRDGGEYPVYKRMDKHGNESVLLDSNRLSRGHSYYQIGNWAVSPNEKLLAFVEDTVSRREYRLRIKNLDTGRFSAVVREGISASLAWAADNQTLFYVRQHPQTLLPYQVYRHRLGEQEDTLVYEQADPAYYVSVSLERAQQYILISLSSTDATRILLLDAARPEAVAVPFLPPEPRHEYRIRHARDWFYVRTNWNAPNFRLMRVPVDQIGRREHWEEVVAHREDVLLEDFEVFDDFLVLSERREGLTGIRMIDRHTGEQRQLSFADPAYTASLHSNPELEATSLRYQYSSLTTPDSVFEVDMRTGETTTLKEDAVIGDFAADRYRSERFFFSARDGARVPVSLVYRKDRFERGRNPGYVYAYGAYGFSTNPSFQSRRLSLLDRGFVYAIIHVRGGEEMGRKWYEDGRLMAKRNTFNDFVDGTRELAARGYVDPHRVVAAGGSAGGLLMGVIVNEAPELYAGVVAHVPFVDVVTTMLDESIPLTTGEFTEWGNPKDIESYRYMHSYSPYDQVRAQDYPNLLVTTGLHDSQVQYFEPVKWVSRLRRLKTDNNKLLLDIDMETGHGGSSGRYERYKRDAMEYAFILDVVGET